MKDFTKIWHQGTHKLELRYAPLFERVILDFRKAFTENLRAHGKDYAIQHLQAHYHNQRLQDTLTQVYKTAGVWGARLQADELKQHERKVKAANFPMSEQWLKLVLAYLQPYLLEDISGITDTMRDDILEVLRRAFEQGLAIDQIVSQLLDKGLVRARARVIARTEVVKAANAGHAAAASERPYLTEKKWSAARDHRTRHSHMLMNGVTILEDQLFKVPIFKGRALVGYDEMLHPCDPKGSAQNVCNCRCRAVYKAKLDASGNLIMRGDTHKVVPMRRSRLSQGQF